MIKLVAHKIMGGVVDDIAYTISRFDSDYILVVKTDLNMLTSQTPNSHHGISTVISGSPMTIDDFKEWCNNMGKDTNFDVSHLDYFLSEKNNP